MQRPNPAVRTIAFFAVTVASVARAADTAPALARDAAGTITIAAPAVGSVVRYSLDGSTPDAKSGPYLAPIELSAGGVVKARAFTTDGKPAGDVAQATYPPLPGAGPMPSTTVAVTQDRSWPQYRWDQRHAACCAAVRQRQPQVVFVGDSITHFWGGEPRDFNLFGKAVWDQRYEPLHAVDLGFGYDRVENALWRVTHGELDAESIRVVVVMIGTNNIGSNKPADVAAGVAAVCRAVHDQRPHAHVLLLGIFPRGQKPGRDRQAIAQVNADLARLDGHGNVTYLDIGHTFLSPGGTIAPDVMRDGLHPTETGYRLWAEAMDPTLHRLLDAPPADKG